MRLLVVQLCDQGSPLAASRPDLTVDRTLPGQSAPHLSPGTLWSVMQQSPFEAGSSKHKDRKNERFASIALQLAVVLLLLSAAFLLAYSYNARPAPAKVHWKPKEGAPVKSFDLASLLSLLPAATDPEPLPDPPQAFFQSIEQDLAPWSKEGISYDHVRFCKPVWYLRARLSFGHRQCLWMSLRKKHLIASEKCSKHSSIHLPGHSFHEIMHKLDTRHLVSSGALCNIVSRAQLVKMLSDCPDPALDSSVTI